MRFGRARQRNLAFIPRETGRSRGRNNDRHFLRFAEQRDFLTAFGYINQHTRVKLDAFQRRAILPHGDFVVVAAIHEFKQAFRQAAARGFAQVGGVVKAQGVVGHGACSFVFFEIIHALSLTTAGEITVVFGDGALDLG